VFDICDQIILDFYNLKWGKITSSIKKEVALVAKKIMITLPITSAAYRCQQKYLRPKSEVIG
jgi:hypothetical protein